MSDIESEACGKGLESEKPKKPNANLGKQYTCRELMKELRIFAADFKDFNSKPIKMSTPQADMGIGPVKYNVELPAKQEMSRKKLDKLNEIIQLEKRNGDRMIKFDAGLLFIATGREDPWHALPALLRMVARAEIQEATRRELERNQIACMKFEIPSPFLPLILHFDHQERIANGSEVAAIADLLYERGGDSHNHLDFRGVIEILSKRRKEKHFAKLAKAKMFTIFTLYTLHTLFHMGVGDDEDTGAEDMLGPEDMPSSEYTSQNTSSEGSILGEENMPREKNREGEILEDEDRQAAGEAN